MQKLSAKVVSKPSRLVKVVQFGEGNFLRAFIDWQLFELNKLGMWEGDVAIVQPLPGSGGFNPLEVMASQDNLYTVVLEGILNGKEVRTREVVDVVAQTLNCYSDFGGYLALAENPDLQIVISNTTEAGIEFKDTDKFADSPASSFPGKLTQLLFKRFEAKLPGLFIIPCELIENNGATLKDCVLKYATLWDLGADFESYISSECTFFNTLVDRIVPGFPRDKAQELWAELGYQDDVMVKAEPYMLWVIEGTTDDLAKLNAAIPLDKANPDDTASLEVPLNVLQTQNQKPYRERKVHLLNGPHTAMTAFGLQAGQETVEEMVTKEPFASHVKELMFSDIIPALEGGDAERKDELEAYAEGILDRFRNPYNRHELKSISLNSLSKFKARLLPVIHKRLAKGMGLPPLVVNALAATINLYTSKSGCPFEITDSAELAAFIRDADSSATSTEEFVRQVLGNADIWGEDLNAIEGLTAGVVAGLEMVRGE